LMISGDQTACAQAMELLGSLETAVVKHASGYFSAECLSPKVTLPMIREAARRSVQRLKIGNAPRPFVVQLPVNVKIEFRQPEAAERAVCLPGVIRINGTQIEITLPDMLAAHTSFRAAVKQAYD
jgi:D-amino peptidase